MRFGRFLWLALLLPQFAVLVLFIYDDMRELRHELQFHYSRTMGDVGMPAFSPLEFGFEALGLAGIIGLCGRRRHARFLYAGFAVWWFAMTIPDLSQPDADNRSLLLTHLFILVTLALCFVPRFHRFHSLSSAFAH